MSWSSGPSDPNGTHQQPPRSNGFFDSLRNSGWYRTQPRVIGGVCSGIAARTGWDLSLVRVLTVLAAFFAPVVIIVYALAWMFLPEAVDGRIHAEETFNGNFDVAFVGGVALALVGLFSVIPSVGVFGSFAIGWGVFTTLIIAGICIAAIASSNNQKSGARMSTPNGPQYGTPGPNRAPGASARFAQGAPAYHAAGAPGAGPAPRQADTAFSSRVAPGAPPAGAGSQRGGHGPASPRPPRAGWTPPASAPTPRRWNAPPAPTHRPRTVSGRANLAITGLLVLITAAVFAGLYWADKGLAIPLITGETVDQTIARIITIGGGVCLLVVGLSLAIAALRDRSAGWLTALSVIGIIMAFPTAAIGTQAARPTDFHINVHPGGINTETTRDWTVDRVSGGNPAGTTVLDLTGAPVGTTKTIVVDWEAWSRLTIQVAEGQPVQIVCQSDIETLSTNMDGNGWASPLNNCAGATATSPSWGKPSLGGITVLITDSAGLDTLTVLQTPDSSGTWGSKPTTTPSATPSATPSTTPSTSPSPTPTGSQSGN